MRTDMAAYAIPLLLGSAVLFSLAAFSWRRRGVVAGLSLSFLCLAAGIWALSDAMLVLSNSWRMYQFWWKTGYIGITALPLTLLVFVLDYAGHRTWLRPRNILMFSGILIVTNALVWTEPHHGLMWTVTDVDWNEPYVPTLERGAWFWVHTTYAYGMMLAAEVIIFRLFKRSRRVYRSQSYAMLAGILLPWLPNVIHVLDIAPAYRFDFTPLSFALSGAALALGVFRFRLRDFVPVARTAVFDDLGDGVIIVNRNWQVIDANPAALDALGIDPELDWTMPLSSLNSDLAALAMARGNEYGGDFSIADPARSFDIRASSLEDHRGNVAGHVIVLRDTTVRKALERQLEHNAQRDLLTRLLNRAQFDLELHDLWNRNAACIVVMFCDVDDFKPVNDVHGHHAGDQVLRVIAKRIVEAVPPHALVARWGGDEFAIAYARESMTEARMTAKRLQIAIKQPIPLSSGAEARVSASVGLAFGDEAHNLGDLLRTADSSMYFAKIHRDAPDREEQIPPVFGKQATQP